MTGGSVEQRVKQEWRKFLTWTSSRNTVNWMFRGQSRQSWPLIPKIGRERNHRFGYNLNSELTLIDEFRKSALLHLQGQPIPTSGLQWMVLAQHHGLPTRLLDWTKSPFIAAFFALDDEDNSDDAVVYAFDLRRRIASDGDHVDPFLIPAIMKVVPTIVSNRIIAQQGAFTIHPHPNEPFAPRPGRRFSKFMFSKDIKKEMKTKIINIGVNRHSIFLNLDGLSDHLTFMNRILAPRDMHFNPDNAFDYAIQMYRSRADPIAALEGDIREHQTIGDHRGVEIYKRVKAHFLKFGSPPR